MQYQVNRGEKGNIEVKVDVPQAGFDEAWEHVLSKFTEETKIEGFRPGKAPKDMVIGRVGSNKILNQAASFLISKHLSQILEKENLVPIDSPKIAVETLAVGSPFAFSASFTQKPQIKVGDWKKIKVVKIKAKEVEEKDIKESIKNIFEAWKKQKEGLRDKETKEPEETENSEKFIYDAKGNKLSIKDSGSPSTKAQDEIDDNFAKAIGAKDIAHLRELVKKDLETIVVDQVEAKFEQEIFDKLLGVATIEVPEILVEDELNRILVRLNSQLEQQGSNLQAYLSEQKTTVDEIKNKWREQATKNVKTTLMMDEIGKEEKVQVTKEELERALAGVSEKNLTTDQRDDLERYLVVSIFQAKTLDLVKKTLTV